MGKSRKTSNDLTLIGVVIIKQKQRSDGEKIILAQFINNKDLWTLVHLDKDGHIADAQCFNWGHNDSIRKKVQLEANRTYKIWTQIMMLHIDDYEIGYRLLND